MEEAKSEPEVAKKEEKAVAENKGGQSVAPKPKALNPVNPSLQRANTKPISAANILPNVTKGVPLKAGPNGRENPRPAQPSTNTAASTNNNGAKPMLKRTNSQQQLVGALSRKPTDVTNTATKQQ
jgi:hypothetical protein